MCLMELLILKKSPTSTKDPNNTPYHILAGIPLPLWRSMYCVVLHLRRDESWVRACERQRRVVQDRLPSAGSRFNRGLTLVLRLVLRLVLGLRWDFKSKKAPPPQ